MNIIGNILFCVMALCLISCGIYVTVLLWQEPKGPIFIKICATSIMAFLISICPAFRKDFWDKF